MRKQEPNKNQSLFDAVFFKNKNTWLSEHAILVYIIAIIITIAFTWIGFHMKAIFDVVNKVLESI